MRRIVGRQKQYRGGNLLRPAWALHHGALRGPGVANESWNYAQIREFMPAVIDFSVELIKQPPAAEAGDVLARLEYAIPLCVACSCRTLPDLGRLEGKYDAVTIGLDRAGAPAEALALTSSCQSWRNLEQRNDRSALRLRSESVYRRIKAPHSTDFLGGARLD
jgi:hypothetical protein